jgi:hypothetical protein
MFIQETFNEYAEPQPRTLAAGAALGDNSQNPSDGKNNSNDDKSQPPKRTPRPPNAFILYRQAKQPGIIASIKNPTNAQVSRQISEMWRNETEEVRLHWERVADRKKLEHMQAHPDYVYRPNKNKNKVDKRRTRPRNASKDQNSIAAALKKSRSQRGVDRAPLVNLPSQINISDLGQHIVPSSLMTPPVSQPSTPVQIRQHQQQYQPIIQSQMPMLTAPNMNELLMHKQQFQPLNAMNPQLSQSTPLTPPQEMLTLHPEFKARYYSSVVPEEEGGKQGSFAHYPGNHELHHQYELSAMFNQSHLDMFVPDVVRQQEQFNSELMLHHPQPEPCTPTSNDSSSASNSPTLQSAEQFYLQPSASTGGYYQGLLSTPIDPYEFIVAYPQ